MAMKELKTFSVAPGAEEQEIHLWRSFGWELVGAPQEIYNENSRLENRDDDIYSVTSTTHYIKLTFERSPDRQNYSELKSLEEQYYAIKDPYYPEPPHFVTIIWSILIIAGLIFLIVPGVILLVLHIVLYVKKNNKWKEDYAIYKKNLDALNAQRQEILTKAQALV